MAEKGRYLYAVCRGLAPADVDHVPGLEQQPLEVLEADGLQALVSRVDLEEFGENGLRRNLERLDWLETVARAHDTVVQAAAALAPTAPTRLATVFRDDEGVRRRVAEQHDRIAAVLDRVQGHQEWSVKVLTRAEPEPVAEEPAASGAEYLRRRRQQQEARTSGEHDAQAVAERVHDALAKLSTASRLLPPQDPRLSGHAGTMVHNAAYLVSSNVSEEFAVAVDELTHEHPGVLLDARGPWPPYSFAILDEP